MVIGPGYSNELKVRVMVAGSRLTSVTLHFSFGKESIRNEGGGAVVTLGSSYCAGGGGHVQDSGPSKRCVD